MLEDGWVDSLLLLLLVGNSTSMAAEFVVVVAMEAGVSGGISTSSTEAKEKDSFSDIVAPERVTDGRLGLGLIELNDFMEKGCEIVLTS